jgi:hypothetical protein
LFGLIAGASSVVVDVLLGPRWTGTALLIVLVAFGGCASLPTILLTSAAEAFGWMRSIWRRQMVLGALLGAVMAIAYVAKAGLIGYLVGVAAVQWVVYFQMIGVFVRRGVLESRAVRRTQIVHGFVSVLAFLAAAGVAWLLHGSGLAVRALAETVVGVGVFGAIAAGRRWFPATRVFALRLEQAIDGDSQARVVKLIVKGYP